MLDRGEPDDFPRRPYNAATRLRRRQRRARARRQGRVRRSASARSPTASCRRAPSASRAALRTARRAPGRPHRAAAATTRSTIRSCSGARSAPASSSFPLNTLLTPRAIRLHAGGQPRVRDRGRAPLVRDPAGARSPAAPADSHLWSAARRGPAPFGTAPCIAFEDLLVGEDPAAPHTRRHALRRGRVLALHLRLDRRPQGRAGTSTRA